jgi:hypothetical protein
VETAEKKEVEIDIDELMRQKRRKEYMDRPRSYLNDEGFSNQRMKKTAPKPIKIIADQANARANIDEKDISQAQSRKMNFSSRPRTYLEKDEEEQAATSKQLQKTKKERPKVFSIISICLCYSNLIIQYFYSTQKEQLENIRMMKAL